MGTPNFNNLRKNSYGVIIGIDQYRDVQIPDLSKARADAVSIFEAITGPSGRIEPQNVMLLLNEKATAKNIRSAIGTKLPQIISDEDFVFLFYAGHGIAKPAGGSNSDATFERYLVPYDGELDDLYATAIAMDSISDWFKRLVARQVVIVIDSCFSGLPGGRTLQHPNFISRASFADESPDYDPDNTQGRIVITACRANEVSIELHNMSNGIFTHFLLEGLSGKADTDEDGYISLNELYSYVYSEVRKRTREIGKPMRPTLAGNVSGRIYLASCEIKNKERKPVREGNLSNLVSVEKDHSFDIFEGLFQLSNFVLIPSGVFVIGEDENEQEYDWSTSRKVRVSNSFYLSRQLISQHQWKTVMGYNPSCWQGDALPVEQVSWIDVQKFIKRLNFEAGCALFRLPTEIEWEYAAGGGAEKCRYKYSGSDNLDSVSWYARNSLAKTHPIGEKLPNKLGLFDMSGNVSEWCQNWYEEDLLPLSENKIITDPPGPASGPGRAIRGGSWKDAADGCRSSHRGHRKPVYKNNFLGFRLARNRI